MAHATPDDVAEYLMRPLSPEETLAAQNYLTIIEIIIRREVDNFAERVASDADFATSVTYVEATIVADVIRNPDRFQYEQAGDYAYSLQQVLQADSLRTAITRDQWWMLGISRGGAFSIDTAVFTGAGGRTPRWWTTIDRRS